MSYPSNLHTHTTFCDGANTPEEMVERALALAYESIGFSSHAYSPDGDDWCLLPEREIEYRDEILRLKEKYADRIEIYLGIEKDVFSKELSFKPEYIIGSLHYINIGDEFHAVDISEEVTKHTVDTCFGGNWYAYADAYYETAAKAAEITGCDIVGHFDLVTKFNEGFKHFDETDIRYRTSAIDALRYEAERCNLFEINTGAISRKKRTTPYPADFLLREMKRLDCEIIITGDSHSVDGLSCAYNEAAELAKAAGYKYCKILRGGRFENIAL